MSEWTLPKMEDLSRYKNIVVDVETNGLDTWAGHRTIGVVLGLIRDDGTVDSRYYAFGHDGGEQYGKGEVVAYLNRELRDKNIIMHNSPFDTTMAIADGVDLRQHNNVNHDTMFGAILINPEDYYSLDNVFAKYVDPKMQKLELPFPKSEMEFHPSHEVGPYAERDGVMTGLLHPVIQSHLTKKKIEGIYRLECDCNAVTVEMMNNGMIVDTDKLGLWIKEMDKKVKGFAKKLGTLNPGSSIQMKAKCEELGIAHPWNYTCDHCTKRMKRVVEWSGFAPQCCPYCHAEIEPRSPHFGKDLMAQIDNPFIKMISQYKTMTRLRDVFLIPWSKQIKRGKILPYELNQLRDKAFDGSTKGTVTGRFSSNMKEGGAQMQQIWSVKNQIEQLGDSHLLRELFIPGNKDHHVLDVDASQIEFRLLAHFSRTNKISDVYNADPFVDYHTLVARDVLQGKLSRKKAKNINFGKIYGMGIPLFSRKMQIPYDEAKEMYRLYESMLPEAKETDDYYERQARLKHEIRTVRGRLFEFDKDAKTHIAMSRLIQGSAADLMKEALIKVYRSGLYSKMRLTVHDEIMGDGDPRNAKKIIELLNDVVGLRVPLRWDLTYSKDWSMRSKDSVRVYDKIYTDFNSETSEWDTEQPLTDFERIVKV